MKRTSLVSLTCAVCLLAPAGLAWAQQADSGGGTSNWLASAASDTWVVENGRMPKTRAPQVENSSFERPIPVSFRLEYGLVSDYVWRGLNFTDLDEPSGDRCNQQLGLAMEVDTMPFGVLGAAIWFDWWSGLDLVMRDGRDRPVENDYTIYWRYPIDAIATTVELGWSCIHLPGFDLGGTQELYVNLGFNDGKLWGVDHPVINPYVFYAVDYKKAKCGSWLEFGVKPLILLNEVGLKDVPVLRDIWLQPSMTVGIDHRYYGGLAESYGSDQELGLNVEKRTRCANITWGLNVGYDIGHALHMPREYGTVTIVGILDYSQQLQDDPINDEFWGGMKIAYSW